MLYTRRMQNDVSLPVSERFDSPDIGLGWLSGVTFLTSSTAVSTVPHRHSHMELIFCLKGEFAYEISGRSAVTLRAGMGIVIPKKTFHSLRLDTGAPGERLGLHIAQRMSPHPEYAVFSPSDFTSFRKTLETRAATPFRLGAALLEDVKQLRHFIARGPRGILPHERGLLRILCCAILYHAVDTLSRPLVAPQPQLMDEAVRWLESHCGENIRMADLIRHMGYSRARFFTLFKAHTGLSPNDFLVRTRIRKAEQLLAETDEPVSRIAAAVGIPDASYFGSVFKRYTGRAPGQGRAATRRC